MKAEAPGYSRDLFVLPFDHRSSFEAGLLGIRGREPDAQEVSRLSEYKRTIYDGLVQAIEGGVPPRSAAVLVDQKYGLEILADANGRGIISCAPVEKSGQDEFDFEYGESLGARLEEAVHTFAKVLVRYNSDGDGAVNGKQRRRLKVLSDHTRAGGSRFMFELLVPATDAQLEAVGGDRQAYDRDVRPELAMRTIAELHAEGIEPDVWKVEGMDDPEAAVGVIVLGRGENEERVRHWLAVGGRTEGFIGFAVGRTVFWQLLVDQKDGACSREVATGRIAATYRGLYDLFIAERRKARAA